MDPATQIAKVEAKIDALLQQLEKPGIDKDERIAIRKNIDTFTAKSTELYKQVPPPPDNRSIWKRGWDSLIQDPVSTGLPFLGVSCGGLYTWLYLYTPIRHHYAPYTVSQMARREMLFPEVFCGGKVPTAAKLMTFAYAFLLVINARVNVGSMPHAY